MSGSVSRGNALTVTLPFSFKGKTFRPCCHINLDEMMEKGSIPCLYTHLANENQIDIHSYEYDVMMMGELEFEEAEGMAKEFIHGSHFDSEGFQARWHEKRVHDLMQDIAVRCMGIEHLEEHADLNKALLEAYHLGIKSSGSS